MPAVDVVRSPARNGSIGNILGRPGRRSGAHAATRRRWSVGIVIAIYVAIGVAAFMPAWSQGPNSTIMYCGCSDEATQVWFLNWGAYAIAHGQNPLFSLLQNYPYGVNMVTNTAFTLLALVAAPLTWSIGAIATYNVLLSLAMPASAASAYVLLRRWTRSDLAAMLGGAIYGFSPYVIGQVIGGHLNLAFVPVPPLALIVLDNILVRQVGRPRFWGASLGLLALVQLGISIEILATMAVTTMLGTAVLCVLHPRDIAPRVAYVARASAWALCIFIPIAAYPIWMMLAGPQHVVGSPQGSWGAVHGRVDLLGAIVPTSKQWLTLGGLSGRANLFTIGPDENGAYLGVPLLIIVPALLYLSRNRKVSRFCALMAIIMWVLSLGSHLTVDNRVTRIPLPFVLFTKLPLLKDMLANRLSVYVVLFVAVVVATGVDGAIQRAGTSLPRLALGGSVIAIAVAPLVPVLPLQGLVPTASPQYFASSAVQRIPHDSIALIYPFSTPISNFAELWQIRAGMRFALPGGYFVMPSANGSGELFEWDITSATLFELYQGGVPAENATLRQQLLSEWHSWRVDSVLFAPMGKHPTRALRFLEWVLGRPPDRTTGGISAWYNLLHGEGVRAPDAPRRASKRPSRG